MNCTNCGAPLTFIAGRDYGYCTFCSTFEFPTPLEESPDGITPLGESSNVGCPVCEGRLSLGAIKRGHVLYCEKCRGLLVDSEQFAHLVCGLRADRDGPPKEPTPLDPKELDRHIDCPSCGCPMEVHPYYGPGNVVIDSCCRCGVIWLDYGEIAGIASAPGR